MPTCRDIITLALQMAKVLPLGEQPSAEEADSGLTALQGMYDRWVVGGMFGELHDVYSTTDIEAKENQRITLTAGTVTLPTVIDDDPERGPYDLSVVETFADDVRTVWLFDRTGWVNILGLTLDDEAPLALRGATGLAANLCMEWADAFGEQLRPSTARIAATFKSGLFARQGASRAEGVWF